ncbi:transcription factor TFIIIC subunit tfc4 [Madurella fahalii]|uniref:Transcription factor TFIIIC subunit tfc4 n=1 Tax=Madurella fahalii TaxID=1157608 RepID=A0ABQ0GRQ8_9PEZI
MNIDQPAAPAAYTADNFPMAMVDPNLYQQPTLEQQDTQMDDDQEDDVVSDISADSDALELRAEVERFDLLQEAFVARQRAEASGIPYQPPPPRKLAGKAGLGGRKKPRRVMGPRKAAKLPPDIQFRMSLANEAFQQNDYDRTIAQLSEIIRINSEVFHAWTLLSTVHETLGNREQAIWCRISAAHLTPRDVQQWISTAEYALECLEDLEDGPEKDEVLRRAYACYTQALETDRSNIVARTGRADVIMLQGNASKALAEYQKALNYRPWNIRTVRNIADVALDVKDPRKSADVARGAYRRLVDYLQANGTFDAEEGRFEWSDLRIYLEFFTIQEKWQEGAQQLKEISRWLLGRRAESYWDQWTDDDREWDIHDDRRVAVPDFEPARFPQDSYGQGLPVDLRAKLYVYRSKVGLEYEANLHLQLLDPARAEGFMDFPDCLKDIAVALLDRDRADEAIRYLELYRHIATTTGDVVLDADFLVCQGRYHMAFGEKAAAEECFIAAIEEDEDHIEARVQLANMYEGEAEQEGREEAFLLVREAMNLEARRGDGTAPGTRRRRGPYGPRKPREKKPRKPRDPNKKSKYVPRRLINAEKRRQQDLEMTAEAAKNFQLMKELEGRAVDGDEQAKTSWMRAAKDLVDDFRSYKQFYPWEKYIKFLGYAANVQGGQAAVPARNMKLAAMEERLRQNLAPVEGQEQTLRLPIKFPSEHRGIPFDTWLDIFLNYAFALVRSGQHREAYIVCHAARDSVVWTSTEATFLIHVAWASCAVYAGDEETCVAIARYFMRDYMPGTDSYRMFSAMCRVCQTPVSWYTSGPAQKFILRQIKTMDNIVMKKAEGGGGSTNQNAKGAAAAAAAEEEDDDAIALDVCLLTIYGHILFTTTSYTYALSYFARAASLDPSNCLINLSTALAYIHYALKRQATNRQYLLTQGFAFLFRYYRDRLAASPDSPAQRQEAHFNVARAYSLIGLGNLAVEYYKKVLDEAEGTGSDGLKGGVMGDEDLTVEAAYNIRSMCYLLGDVEGARAVAGRWLVLE